MPAQPTAPAAASQALPIGPAPSTAPPQYLPNVSVAGQPSQGPAAPVVGGGLTTPAPSTLAVPPQTGPGAPSLANSMPGLGGLIMKTPNPGM